MSTTTEIKTTKFNNVFTPAYENTDATRTWAATVFGDVPVIVKLCERDCKNTFKAKTRRDKSGHVFRRAFHIAVVSGEKIYIHLYRRATLFDLKRAQRMVKQAQDGVLALDLWDEATSWDGYKMIAWLQVDPEKYSPELRPCLDSNCVKAYHSWETRDEEYQGDACVADRIVTDDYSIVIQNWRGGDGWEAYCDLSDWQLENANDLRTLDRVRNDFAYLLGECDRLNQKIEVTA